MSVSRAVCQQELLPKVNSKEKQSGLQLTGECYVGLLLMSNEQTACFHADKWRFHKTDTCCCAALSMVIFLLICKFKTAFIPKSQLLFMGCPFIRQHKPKKNPIFNFNCVLECLTKSVHLKVCNMCKCKYKVCVGGKKKNRKKFS